MRDFYEDYDSALIKNTFGDHTVMLMRNPELLVVWFHYDSFMEMEVTNEQARAIADGRDPVAEKWKDWNGRRISVENATLAHGDLAIKNVAGELFRRGQRSATLDQSHMTKPFADKVRKAMAEFEREDEKRIEDLARSLLQEGYDVNDIDDLVHTYRVRYNDADRVREYMREIPHGHVGKSKSVKSKDYPKKKVKVGRKTMILPDDGKGHVPKPYLKEVNAKRSKRSLAQDNIHRAAMTYPSPTPSYMAANWIRHPNKYDIEGIDAPKMSKEDELAYSRELSGRYSNQTADDDDVSYLEDCDFDETMNDTFWKHDPKRAARLRAKHDWDDFRTQEMYNASFGRKKKRR